MKFIKVTSENIDTLYDLNRQLATAEGQKDLFTAAFEEYSKGFLADRPIAYGTLCYQDNIAIGFAICNYKFATYLGSNVLYIEDIYLKETYNTNDNKKELLHYLIELASAENCARVEMRVLNNCNLGTELINELGFEKIEKWSVYRLSNK
jgi:hypothetical protein